MLNLPNLLSVCRICLVPLFLWLVIINEFELAFAIFVIAGVTDAVDGFLAKQFGWETELGAYLDPLADKALLVSAFAILGFFGHLPAWLVIIVISRDILIIAAMLLSWMLNRPMHVHPLMISKVNTACQIVLIIAILADLGFTLGISVITRYLVLSVGVLTLLSAAAYLFAWLRHMATYEEQKSYGRWSKSEQQKTHGGFLKPANDSRQTNEYTDTSKRI